MRVILHTPVGDILAAVLVTECQPNAYGQAAKRDVRRFCRARNRSCRLYENIKDLADLINQHDRS